MLLVELRRLSRSTGLRVLEERRKSAPSGAEVGSEAPSGAEVGNEAPSRTEVGRLAPSGERDGGGNRVVVVGERKVDSGPEGR